MLTLTRQAGHAVPTDGHGKPLVHIDPVAERRLRWKFDLMLTPIAALMYLFCLCALALPYPADSPASTAPTHVAIRRCALTGQIGNARIAGLERDLRMTGYDCALF